jgi:hypothetical protein
MKRNIKHSAKCTTQQPGSHTFLPPAGGGVSGGFPLCLSRSIGRGRLGGGFMFLLLLLASFVVQAQTSIGGADRPLKYSVHNYKVSMGSQLNTTEWRIYNRTASRDSIDLGLVVQYPSPQYYMVDLSHTGKSGGVDSITIQFSGDLPIKQSLTLVYIEKGSTDQCLKYEFFDFILQEPIDIDVDPDNIVRNLSSCPDSALNYLEGDGSLTIPATKTTIRYVVRIVNPDGVDTVYSPASPPASGNWGFRYNIKIRGQSGANAVISEINFNPSSVTLTPNASDFGAESPPVSNNNINYEVLVTYNDVPGVRQKIDLNLTLIHGSYQEVDIDEKFPAVNQNDLSHFISSMPRPSYIAALD